MRRRKTRVVKVGGVRIGGGNPVVIQSMAKTDTRDAKRTIAEIRRLEKAGCEIVRVAVKDKEAAESLKTIKKGIRVPLVADIHFDYRLALESIKMGADKIRVNPGNMPDAKQLKEVIRAAKRRRIPIRIGLNSGSIAYRPPYGPWKSVRNYGLPRSVRRLFVRTALRYIKVCQREDFRDIIISLKSSNVAETVSAYRELADLSDYPFHLGVTAAGSHDAGIVKSSIAIGALLLDGIGDTIRVSLTGDPVEEVVAAKRILQSLNLRAFGPEIISCPTCGRCQVDLAGVAQKFEAAIRKPEFRRPGGTGSSTVAIMGCEVNGPGEAKMADIGVAFGKDSGILFKKGKIIKKVKAKDTTKELVRLLRAASRRSQ